MIEPVFEPWQSGSRASAPNHRCRCFIFHLQTFSFSLITFENEGKPVRSFLIHLKLWKKILIVLLLGNYSRREGTRGSSWSAQNTPRGTYNESRGGQSNFNRGPLPPLRPLSSTGIFLPLDTAERGGQSSFWNCWMSYTLILGENTLKCRCIILKSV